MASTMPSKIDVHSHFLPDFYQDACRRHGHSNPDGTVPAWDESSHLALMDELGIQKSIISISSPGTHLIYGNDTLARDLTRKINSFASDLKKRHPSRFGYFASLPIPDIQGSLAEIPKAMEEGADGFVLLTNSHGTYLGDAALDAIFDELNRRKALIFIHPTTPKICPCNAGNVSGTSTEMPTSAAPFGGRVPNPMQEFFFDTARVVSNLFMSGTMRRCPDLRIILPHLGGAFPPLLSRWTGFSELVPGSWEDVNEETVKETLRTQVWFDMAGFSFVSQIVGLMAGVGVGHERLMYGSDYPFTQAGGVKTLLTRMDAGVKELFNERQIEDLYHGNADKLLEM
ncbi:amidohydrolase 2-like protein [Dothistroma septosporum NZE10]|uniref:6-methylsalicylate decarboxylase n=1 Tax=Dothistroma septosporum (strain NZE10 / CBS 128990) TaxID=675120 RepID=N1PCE1_DOTSN|nr:amidohydrolase 2-like protein [Dothistroma septosporum NZE10]